MYKHQVQWYGPNLLEVGGRESGKARVAPSWDPMLRAKGREYWCRGPRSLKLQSLRTVVANGPPTTHEGGRSGFSQRNSEIIIRPYV